ncbi:MAG: hypothetical protein AAF902_20175 [Chloroflexota bacterium]
MLAAFQSDDRVRLMGKGAEPFIDSAVKVLIEIFQTTTKRQRPYI